VVACTLIVPGLGAWRNSVWPHHAHRRLFSLSPSKEPRGDANLLIERRGSGMQRGCARWSKAAGRGPSSASRKCCRSSRSASSGGSWATRQQGPAQARRTWRSLPVLPAWEPSVRNAAARAGHMHAIGRSTLRPRAWACSHHPRPGRDRAGAAHHRPHYAYGERTSAPRVAHRARPCLRIAPGLRHGLLDRASLSGETCPRVRPPAQSGARSQVRLALASGRREAGVRDRLAWRAERPVQAKWS